MNSILWQSVLGELEVTVSEAAFATWFKPTKLISYDENEVIISVNNVFVKKQLESKLNQNIGLILLIKKYMQQFLLHVTMKLLLKSILAMGLYLMI